MNKLFLSFLVPWMSMPLWSADFTGSIAHVSSDNHTIIVTERPEQDRYTAYVTMTLDVASIQAYRAATSCELSNIISFQIAKYTNELGLSLKNDDFVIHNGNYFQQMSTNLTLSEPANVTTSLEHIDSIFSADVTHAALTLSYSRAGTYGYLSVLKSDGSVAYYADVYNGYKTEGPSRYVEYIIFNPDYVLSADVCIQDGMKAIYAKDAYELNATHFFAPDPTTDDMLGSPCIPEPTTTTLALLALSTILPHRRRRA